MLFRLEKGVITHDKDSQVVVSYMDQNELSDEDINQLHFKFQIVPVYNATFAQYRFGVF